MGGELTVVNKAQPSTDNFKVRVDGNVKIQNFKGNRGLNEYETRTTVKNGQVTNWFRWGGAKAPTKERALNLGSSNFTLFDKLRKADAKDKKGTVLTRSDLEAVRKNKKLQQQLGLSAVRYDANEKVYCLVGKDGNQLYFDYE